MVLPAHHVVIVGGGFGGLYAARSLRKSSVRVTLVDRRNFHLFQPLLYQVATAALSPANIASPLRYILKKQSNVKVYLSEVTGVDLKSRTVHAKEGDLHYDSLIVAAGADNNYFGHPEWAQFAPGLKTLEEATDIRRRILFAFESAEKEQDRDQQAAWLTFVIVGAGPTGVELAGSLAEIARDTLRNEFRNIETGRARILLIDSVDRVLMTYPPDLSAKAENALRQLGVTFQSRTRVTDIQADRVVVRREGNEEIIASRTVLWAAGVQGSPLGRILAEGAETPLQKGGRVAVDPDLSLPGYPEVYVIGDMAHVVHEGQSLPGTAPVAMQEGRYVALKIGARLENHDLAPFRYWHKGDMATIGRAAGVANFGRIRFDGFLAWVSWLFIHLWFIVEFEDRLLVFLQWAWNYFTHNRSARLITGDTPKPQSQH